ncbi:TetR/AcrR family transcriptional regulator [Actinomadura kijaniata]|uniref:TetR/AcrR family transcriptional regulator n=1 Tax=Actinomadura kijaniata TaxID=46161 RepID=UPI00082A04EC|nr:TetR/AcrR family transcriptional regulator C-terminal domain-containing protein [Actinomadura kijaniata]
MDPETLWNEPARPRLGRPPAHSRAEITAAAVAVADAEGLPAVTMRRVATEIGAGVMSLYTYVRDKETLLELMIDHVVGEAGTAPPTGDWRADLRAVALAQRVVLRRHPWLAEALPQRRTFGPHTLAQLEHALAVLEPSGMDVRAAMEAFSLVTSFVSSHVTYERRQRDAGASADELRAQVRYLRKAVESGRYPRLARALDEPDGDHDPEAVFDRLLDRVINGLAPGG